MHPDDEQKARPARTVKKGEGWREREESNLARKTLPATEHDAAELRPACC